MSLESDRIRGEDAKALLNNRILKEAFAAVGEYLEAQATSCDPDNKDKAARIIISKQLLAGIQREITRVIENGMIADVKLSEIEKRRGLKTIFQR